MNAPRDDVRELLREARDSLDALQDISNCTCCFPDNDCCAWSKAEGLILRIDTALAPTTQGTERWSWGYSDGTPGTPEYEPPRRICNWCKTVESRCQCGSQGDEQPAIHDMTDAECATAYRELRKRANHAGFATVGEWIDEQPDTDGEGKVS